MIKRSILVFNTAIFDMIFSTTARVYLTLIPTLFVLVSSLAQRPDFDRLKKDVLEAQTQKEKAQAIMVLGGALSSREVDKIFDYADSVLLFDETDNQDFFKNTSTYLKALGFYKKGDLDQSKALFKNAANYFLSIDDDTYFKSFNFIGIIHLRMNHPDSAIFVFTQILNEIDEDNKRGRLSAHGNLGRAYRTMGRYTEAIENFEQCVMLDSANQFSKLNSFLNVAGMYRDMEFYDRGIATLKEVDISKIDPQPALIAYYSNLGDLYYRDNQLDTALSFLDKGLSLALQLRQPQQAIGNRLTQSEIYLDKNDTESALKMLNAAEKDMKYYSPFPVKMNYTLKKADYYLKKDLYDSAIITAKDALKVASRNNSKQVGDLYRLVAEAFEGKGNTDSSSYYYKTHATFKESDINTGKEKFQQDARAKYLLAEKENEITQSQSESNQLKLWQKLLITLLVVLILMAIYIYLRLRKSRSELDDKSTLNQFLTKEIKKNKNTNIELKSRALLPVDDIISIKVDGHYLEFKLASKSNPEIDRNQIKAILNSLPSKFVQIHRSYVVNVSHIKVKKSDKVILKDGSELPVSRTFKDRLNEALDLV